MSADTDGWEVVRKDAWSANGSPPQLTIYQDGGGRLNANADRALDEPAAVQLLVKPDQARIGLAPAEDPDGLDAYSVTRGDGAGGDVRPKSALERAGVDVDALDGTNHFRLEEQGEILVADVSDLSELTTAAAPRTGDRAPDASAADTENDEDETTDDEDGYACREDDCDFISDSEHGRNIHESRMHDDADDPAEELTPDDVDLPGGLTEGDVHAVADFLDDIESVAEDFEVDVERAERILRAHDCLDEVSR